MQLLKLANANLITAQIGEVILPNRNPSACFTTVN